MLLNYNIYDPYVSLKLEYNLGCSITGNKHKLLNCAFCHDLRKYYFSARIINIWNSLPNCVVDVSTINQFKARLDKFWMHQDVLYDYTADLTGIGDRSHTCNKRCVVSYVVVLNRCGHWGVNTCVRTCSLSWVEFLFSASPWSSDYRITACDCSKNSRKLTHQSPWARPEATRRHVIT